MKRTRERKEKSTKINKSNIYEPLSTLETGDYFSDKSVKRYSEPPEDIQLMMQYGVAAVLSGNIPENKNIKRKVITTKQEKQETLENDIVTLSRMPDKIMWDASTILCDSYNFFNAKRAGITNEDIIDLDTRLCNFVGMEKNSLNGWKKIFAGFTGQYHSKKVPSGVIGKAIHYFFFKNYNLFLAVLLGAKRNDKLKLDKYFFVNVQ